MTYGRSVVSSTNKTDRHDITEILLKVALNTINHNHQHYSNSDFDLQDGRVERIEDGVELVLKNHKQQIVS